MSEPKFKHACYEWDELVIDETWEEFQYCGCRFPSAYVCKLCGHAMDYVSSHQADPAYVIACDPCGYREAISEPGEGDMP